MSYRVPSSNIPDILSARINVNRHRLNVLQEQLTTGRRINRPSDDPAGAELVINLKTTRAELSHFQRVAVLAHEKLTSADSSFNNYETNVDRVRALIAAGLSDVSGQTARNALADEIEALKSGILNFANTRNGNEYVFGGNRQGEPPFDPLTGAPAATPTTSQYVQVEPGTNALATGVTAESFLIEGGVTIFEDLDLAIAALRGTGDPVADQAALNSAMSRMQVFQDLSANSRSRIGINMETVEKAGGRLATVDLAILESISNTEDVDFATAALQYADAQTSLEAVLSVAGRARRSLIDFLG